MEQTTDNPISVGVIGAAGRMGLVIASGLHEDSGFSVDALYDIAEGDVLTVGHITADLAKFLSAPTTHVVDFSSGAGVDENGEQVLRAGKHYLVGATGYSGSTLARLEAAAAEADTECLIIPNFSLGANLMMEFARRAAEFFDSVEIVERHHLGKQDAPSGTAIATAKEINEARQMPPGPDEEKVQGVRGGQVCGINIHSQRLDGLLAEQEVTFGGYREILRIEHRSITRECFLPGVKMALRAMGQHAGLRIGMKHVLEVQK
jgi:4-hydroxy-tetrahydrodipicolinate reductase